MPVMLTPNTAQPVVDPRTGRITSAWLAPFTFLTRLLLGDVQGQVMVYVTGTPEGQVVAPVGSLALRKDGGVGTTLYVKESGTGSTGWAAK